MDWARLKHNHRADRDLVHFDRLGPGAFPRNFGDGGLNRAHIPTKGLVALVPNHFHLADPTADRIKREVVPL